MNGFASSWVERYRPYLLQDINGQHVIKSQLDYFSKNIQELPHLIFYGSSGIGKSSSTYAFIRESVYNYLNKRQGLDEKFNQNPHSCETNVIVNEDLSKEFNKDVGKDVGKDANKNINKDINFKSIRQFNPHSSCEINSFCENIVLRINASLDRTIDVVRDKIETFVKNEGLNYNQSLDRLYKFPYKFIVLEEADKFTTLSQGALRNIMDENGNHIRFIFTCNCISQIIYPIQSRCYKMSFLPLSPEEIEQSLRTILKCENCSLDISSEILQYIGSHLHGDLRNCISRLQILVHLNSNLSQDLVLKFLDIPCIHLIHKWTDFFFDCPKKNGADTTKEWINKHSEFVNDFRGWDTSQCIDLFFNSILDFFQKKIHYANISLINTDSNCFDTHFNVLLSMLKKLNSISSFNSIDICVSNNDILLSCLFSQFFSLMQK